MTDDSGAPETAVPAPAALPAPPPAPVAPVTAGGLLREAREAAGLHIAALAVSMKVPVAKLEALEADRFDLLPDAVFARALASGVCRQLKVDARPVLDKLPQSAKPMLRENERGIDAPFRSPSDGPGPGLLDKLSWPVAVVGLLVVGMVGIYFYPHRGEAPAASTAAPDPVMPADKPGQVQVVQSPDAPPPGTVVETATAALPVPAPTAPVAGGGASAGATQALPGAGVAAPALAPAPVVAGTQPATQAGANARLASGMQHAASAAPARAPQGAASTPVKPASSPLVAAKPASAAVPPAKPASAPDAAAAASQPVAFAPSAGALVLRAKAPSWVSVIDARGVSLLNKVLASGEVAAVSGATPLKVTVGKADGTEVLVRGKAFDLAPVARENVARFEVK